MWQLKIPQSFPWAFYNHANLKSDIKWCDESKWNSSWTFWTSSGSMRSKYKWEIEVWHTEYTSQISEGKLFPCLYTWLILVKPKFAQSCEKCPFSWLSFSAIDGSEVRTRSQKFKRRTCIKTDMETKNLTSTSCKQGVTGLLFFLLFSFFPLRSPLSRRLHASPSSQRIYRGEKDLKGLEKKLNCLLIL